MDKLKSIYFPHDSNARHDSKIMEMRCVYGGKGYGWYWMLIEILRNQAGYRLKYSGKYSIDAIAMELGTETEEAKKFITDCIEEFELFEADNKFFWSNSLVRRMANMEEIIEKRKKAANARWDKERNKKDMHMDSKCNASAMQMQSTSNAIKENKIKEKYIKENNNIINNNANTDFENDGDDGVNNNDDINFRKIIKIFNSNVHPITAIEKENLEIWFEKFNWDIIVWAIKQAVLHNKRNMRYIDGILINLEKEGIDSMEGIEAMERDRFTEKYGEDFKQKQKISAEEKEKLKKLNAEVHKYFPHLMEEKVF